MSRKTRSDARIPKLTKEQKATLLGWFEKNLGLKEMVRLVYSEFDISTNPTSLSEWYSSYNLSLDFRNAALLAGNLREQLEELPIKLEDDFLSQVTQAKFEKEVAERGDIEGHVALRKLRQKDQDQRLAERSQMAAEQGFRLRYEQKERELKLAEDKFDNQKFKVAEQTKKLREKGAAISDEERLQIVNTVDSILGIS